MFLLDTVIISEIRKKQPDSGVIEWLSSQPGSQLYLSVVTLGEIERGIERRRKTEPAFAATLAAWLESLTLLYADRILPITPAIVRRWGRLSAQIGNDSADLLIAATGLAHHLTVVTCNVSHFEPTGIAVVNPFS